MSLLPIRVYPDPILRARCPPVEVFDDRLRRLARDMVETMYAAPGVGLAAPQVGESLRLAVVDVTLGKEPDGLHTLVNPVVVDRQGATLDLEGCLSIPEVTEKVERPARVRVRAQDLAGRSFELDAEGFLARAVCHEVDHLDGVLFVQRLSGLRRQRAERRLRRILREQAGRTEGERS